jgi:hypothetical protein
MRFALVGALAAEDFGVACSLTMRFDLVGAIAAEDIGAA